MTRLEWPTLALLFLCYSMWLVGAALWSDLPALALILMTLTGALHSSLTHECVHGHPTRSRRLNELLAAPPLTLIHPFRRYKALHLAHHNDARLTDPMADPESYYVARWKHDRMPAWLRGLLAVNNTLLGRIVLGPVIGAAGFLASEARLLAIGAPGVRTAWTLHAITLAPFLVLLQALGIPLWAYALGVVWPALALISVRTFAEHQWHEAPEGRTIIVERSVLAWLFLNNNLHIVHHKLPGAPWYALPALYARQRAYWREVNRGYVFGSYVELVRRYGLRPKEPVVHPALHLSPPPDQTPLAPPLPGQPA